MIEILSIVGQDTGDYFQIQCADCGSPTKNTYAGWDPAIPFFVAECATYGKKGKWKLDRALWKGLPPQPHRTTNS